MDSLGAGTAKSPICPTGWNAVRSPETSRRPRKDEEASINIQEAEEFQDKQVLLQDENLDIDEIKKEECQFPSVLLPVFYDLARAEEREQILYKNFVSVTQDVKAMIETILGKKEGK
jgi:hypothetical protein